MTTTHSNIYSLQIQIKWCILEDNGVHIVCTQTNVVYGVENAVSQWRRSKGREGEKGLGQLSHTCPPCRWPWSTGRPQRCLRGAGPWRLGKRRVDDKWVALHGVFMMQVTVPHAHTHTHISKLTHFISDIYKLLPLHLHYVPFSLQSSRVFKEKSPWVTFMKWHNKVECVA